MANARRFRVMERQARKHFLRLCADLPVWPEASYMTYMDRKVVAHMGITPGVLWELDAHPDSVRRYSSSKPSTGMDRVFTGRVHQSYSLSTPCSRGRFIDGL